MPLPNLTRDRLLRLGTGAFAGAAASVLGVASERTPVSAEASQDTIMIVRHAEKPIGDKAPFGVDSEGQINAGSLTVRGWVRAGALARAFSQPNDWNVPVPNAIYASRPGETTGLRAVETVTPLADFLDLKVNASIRRGDETALAAALLGGRGARLVAWEHRSIPDIVAKLGTVVPEPSPKWDASRFDIIWCFTRSSPGVWHFRSIPQRLLSGDEPRT